jgi:hypothetical protein
MRLESKLFWQRLGLAVLLIVSLAVAAPAHAQNHPFTVMSGLNSTTPFNVTLPSTLPNGKLVKTVIIEFVTADCVATTGTTYIGSAFIKVFFSGNFAFYTLPFQPGMSFVNQVEFSSASTTLMFADPGSTLNYGLSAGQPTCTVAFSGRLIPA